MEFMIVVWIAMGVLCAVIAGWKNRNPAGWFFIGALFSVFGLAAVLAAPRLADPLPQTHEEIAAAPAVESQEDVIGASIMGIAGMAVAAGGMVLVVALWL